MKVRELLETYEHVSVPTVGMLIHDLDEKPEFKQYRNQNASYDDVVYEIPQHAIPVWLTPELISEISEITDDYEGDIYMQDNTVFIVGGS